MIAPEYVYIVAYDDYRTFEDGYHLCTIESCKWYATMPVENYLANTTDHVDIMLSEQIAIFAAEFPVPEEFPQGQAEWIGVIIEEAKNFCIYHKDTNWSEEDWYLTSDAWMNNFIGDL